MNTLFQTIQLVDSHKWVWLVTLISRTMAHVYFPAILHTCFDIPCKLSPITCMDIKSDFLWKIRKMSVCRLLNFKVNPPNFEHYEKEEIDHVHVCISKHASGINVCPWHACVYCNICAKWSETGPLRQKTYLQTCASSEYSDQHAHSSKPCLPSVTWLWDTLLRLKFRFQKSSMITQSALYL